MKISVGAGILTINLTKTKLSHREAGDKGDKQDTGHLTKAEQEEYELLSESDKVDYKKAWGDFDLVGIYYSCLELGVGAGTAFFGIRLAEGRCRGPCGRSEKGRSRQGRSP